MSSSSFGFGTITSQGVGSSLDVAGIVRSLMDIERVPLDKLVAQQTGFEAKISAFGSIKSTLSSLQSSLAGLKSGDSLLANKAESSDTGVVNVTGTSGAVAGNYSLSVSQLAQSQKLVAVGQADTTTAIGNGTLTIDLGTISGGVFDGGTGKYTGASFASNGSGPFNITIDASNNTLDGIRDAINAADIGITASIVNDGSSGTPQRLVLSTASGVDQSINLSVAGDAALSNLLSNDPAGVQNLSQTVTAQNAIFNVDGIAITKASNSVTDVISGVTLDLKGVTSGTPVTVSISQDTDSAKTAVESFVGAYNDLLAEIKKQTDSGYSSGERGALASDSVTRQILSSIRNELITPPTGVSGAYSNLSSIGVSFQRDGTLALDSDKLTTAIQDDSNNVAELFSSTDGYATRLDNVVTGLLGLNGTIASRTEAYETRIGSLEDRQLTLEGRLARTELRYRAQFTNLDVLMNSISTTSSFLTQQLDILNGQMSNK